MRLKNLLILLPLITAKLGFAQPQIQLELFADGFSSPVDIANCGDERLFIVERAGRIKIADLDGTVHPGYFLDIADQIESGYQEQGLLGLAFHPDYASNGYFYVNYIDLDGNTVISRFSVSAGDPDVADEGSELVMMNIDQPFVNHNGGCIKFGPDGYLYIGMGDGGSAGDPGDRAQNTSLRLGKMLRIDVNGALPFDIPADNPFVGAADTLPEIWSIGLRNPWRFSFDRATGMCWIADVGQNLYEELNVEPAATGGLNYGWRCYEGLHSFNLAGCDADTATYTFPIMEYPHNFTTGGFSVTGGFVYRGAEYPGMFGYYLCADYVSGNWWWVNADGGAPYSYMRMDDVQTDISCYGEDVNGEMYCANLENGDIYHITDACGAFAVSGTSIDYICGVQDGLIDITVEAGTAPYTYDWSNGATDEDISVSEGGVYTVTVTDAEGCERISSFTVEDIAPFDVLISEVAGTLTASTGVSWQWYQDGELITGATAQTYSPTEPGSYTVVATDANGCAVSSAAYDFTVNINDQAGLSELSVYPNPVDDVVYVAYTLTGSNENVAFQLMDVLGNTINTFTAIKSGKNVLAIPMGELPDGIYYLRYGARYAISICKQ